MKDKKITVINENGDKIIFTHKEGITTTDIILEKKRSSYFELDIDGKIRVVETLADLYRMQESFYNELHQYSCSSGADVRYVYSNSPTLSHLKSLKNQ